MCFWNIASGFWFFLAALALRLLFYFRFPHITGDSLIYGDIASNWLDQGIFGLTHAEGVRPTWIRLPGYPAFLVLCFTLFGREHYHAVLLVANRHRHCRLLCHRRLSTADGLGPSRQFAFALAAVCPFTANYTVAPLAETLSIFFTAVALDAAVAGFMHVDDDSASWKAWTCCGVALSAGIQLRPDGGILLAAIGLFLLWRMWQTTSATSPTLLGGNLNPGDLLVPTCPLDGAQLASVPQVRTARPTLRQRSRRVRSRGFDRWVRTWIADYASTEEIYWQIPGSDVDPTLLPSRAFDNQQEQQQTQAIFDDYAKSHFVGPELNARFDAFSGTTHSPPSAALLRLAADCCASPTCGCVRAPKCFRSIRAGGSTPTTRRTACWPRFGEC